MKKDSALTLLPSYKLQIRDANCIFAIIGVSVMLGNLMLLFHSINWTIRLLVLASILLETLAIFFYKKLLPALLKSDFDGEFYICAIIEYLLILIVVLPICTYLYVDMQWTTLNKYGTECLVLFNQYENWLIPISVFLMISLTYWLIVHYIKKESKLFYQLEKKKKELYE